MRLSTYKTITTIGLFKQNQWNVYTFRNAVGIVNF